VTGDGAADRIADLERRVAALEAAASGAPPTAPGSPATPAPPDVPATSPADGPDEPVPAQTAPGPPTGPPAGPAGTGGPDPEVFWALAGLRTRAPAAEGGAVLFAGVVRTPDGATWEWQEAHPAADLLDRSWEDAGAALEALASPVRMLLLREVLHGRNTAAELAELAEFGTSGQVYHHLRRLVAAGWLRSAARGRYVVPPERIVPLLTAIAAVHR
jgi:hypothetical protein